MKIVAYVVGGMWKSHPGLVSKISNAARIWETMGLKVFILSPAEGKIYDPKGDEIYSASDEELRHLGLFYDVSINKIRRFLSIRHQHRFLKKCLLDLKPDIVYSRYAFPFPGLRKAIGIASPYVLEVNSDDLAEYKIGSKITGAYNQLFRNSLINFAAGLCFISQELEKSESFSSNTGKKTTISNSICTEFYPFIPHTNNKEPNLVFIGSPNQIWHGLDKIYILAKNRPTWRFHIIGVDRKNCNLELKIPSNFILHGHLDGEEAKSLVARMDIGISTLALHRKGMNEASPLKSRQYAAQGIPFISGYKDSAISEVDFMLQLPNVENNIERNLTSIDDFVENSFLNSALRKQARRYAERNLDSRAVERERLDFIMSCA